MRGLDSNAVVANVNLPMPFLLNGTDMHLARSVSAAEFHSVAHEVLKQQCQMGVAGGHAGQTIAGNLCPRVFDARAQVVEGRAQRLVRIKRLRRPLLAVHSLYASKSRMRPDIRVAPSVAYWMNSRA